MHIIICSMVLKNIEYAAKTNEEDSPTSLLPPTTRLHRYLSFQSHWHYLLSHLLFSQKCCHWHFSFDESITPFVNLRRVPRENLVFEDLKLVLESLIILFNDLQLDSCLLLGISLRTILDVDFIVHSVSNCLLLILHLLYHDYLLFPAIIFRIVFLNN